MKRNIVNACAASAVAVGMLFAPTVSAAETMTTPVLKTMLEDMPNTEAVVVLFDVEPGWATDHHFHPGHLFVYMLEGTLRLEVDGQEPVEYHAGEAFYELPNVGMVGTNASAMERAKFVVFQFGEVGKPIMVPD